MISVVAACGNGDSAPVEFFDTLERTLCGAMVECSDAPDEDTCRGAYLLDDDGEAAQILAAVSAGKVEFDPEQARSCLAVAEAFPCGLASGDGYVARLDAACEPVFVGRVAAGDTCFADVECQGDSRCDTADCADACCPGTCVAAEPEPEPAAVGEDCGQAPCVSTAYCHRDLAAGTAVCRDRVDAGDTCAAFGACVQGAVCDLDPASGQGTCVVPPGPGESCDPDSLFVPCDRRDHHCAPSEASCRPKPGPGQDCDPAGGVECVEYAACVDGTCVKRPGMDDACQPESASSCLGDLECVAGVCSVSDSVESVCSYGAVVAPLGTNERAMLSRPRITQP